MGLFDLGDERRLQTTDPPAGTWPTDPHNHTHGESGAENPLVVRSRHQAVRLDSLRCLPTRIEPRLGN